MLSSRSSSILLHICSHSFRRRSSCWPLLAAARSEYRVRSMQGVRRSSNSSSESTPTAENTEDALPAELAEMRARMSKLHNVVSTKGIALSDFKRTSKDDDEQDAINSAFSKDDCGTEHFEGSSDEVKSIFEGKRLRKYKDADVVINLPYGHVRFDAMNRPNSAAKLVHEEDVIAQDEIPSVKIVKEGQHVFSLSAVDKNKPNFDDASGDIVKDEMCHVSSQDESEIHDAESNLFEEQYFDNVQQQEEAREAVVADDCSTIMKLCDLKSEGLDKPHFGGVLQHKTERKQKTAQKQKLIPQLNKHQPEEKHENLAKSAMLSSGICDPNPSLFDEQYFSDVLQHEGQKETNSAHSNIARSTAGKTNTSDGKENVFDEQYFGDVLYEKEKQQKSLSNSRSARVECVKDTFRQKNMPKHIEHSGYDPKSATVSDEPHNLVDEQYFGSYTQSKLASVDEAEEEDSGEGNFVSSDHMFQSQQDRYSLEADSSINFDGHSTHVALDENVVTQDHYSTPIWKKVKDIIQDSVRDDDNDVVVEPITRREMKARTRPHADTENPKTAYDLSMKIRLEQQQKQSTESKPQAFVLPKKSKWSGRLDSHGFRILKDQVVNVQYLTQEQVLMILKDSIIHEDDKLVVIDKPYGLPSHGGPGVHHSVGKLLEPLASRIDKSGLLKTLYLVHRLDKETTGVMVLAKSLQVAEFLLAMFKKRQIVKRYWVITKSVPNPQEGVIDIPMAEDIVGKRYRVSFDLLLLAFATKTDQRMPAAPTVQFLRLSSDLEEHMSLMALRPIVKDDGRPLRSSSRMGDRYEAITNYCVLTENGSAALVECVPDTGVKHQIRCHLAFGLNTPILGDHKYSHYSKIAPQKLHPEMLQKLGVRQAKVRHIPMHLHAKVVVLPEWINGRNLFLSARLPAHFVQNMKWLKLKPPSW